MSFREENRVLIDEEKGNTEDQYLQKNHDTEEDEKESNGQKKEEEVENEENEENEKQESKPFNEGEFPQPPNHSESDHKDENHQESETLEKTEEKEKEKETGEIEDSNQGKETIELPKVIGEEKEHEKGEEERTEEQESGELPTSLRQQESTSEQPSTTNENNTNVAFESTTREPSSHEQEQQQEQQQEPQQEEQEAPSTNTPQDWVTYQIPELMKGCVIYKYCESSEIDYREDIQVPFEIGENEVLVHNIACSVNPIDWKVRKGYFSMVSHLKFPHILGCDASGVIVKSNISDFPIGTEVVVLQKPIPSRKRGTYAEYCVADRSNIAKKPSEITHEQAAALPLVGVTVLQSLVTTAHLSEGERILILGGSGGIGHIAVQIAKALGAHVYATCSSSNVDFVRSLGADRVIDYTLEHIEDVVGIPSKRKRRQRRKQRGEESSSREEGEARSSASRPHPREEEEEEREPSSGNDTGMSREGVGEEERNQLGVDVVFDAIGGKDALKTGMTVLKPKIGRFITIVGNQRGKIGLGSIISQGMSMASKKISSTLTSAPAYHFVSVHPDGSDLSSLCDMVSRGELHPHISSTYAPWDMASAHEKSESGHTVGKLVVRMADDPSARPQG